MGQSRGSFFIAAVAIALLAGMVATPPPAYAVVAGQVDTFEDGTTMSWQNFGLSTHPGVATNVSTGGPAGANDNFLRIGSNASGTAGGKLVMFNGSQWAGDYLSADLDAINMHVNNLGDTDLLLRLIFMDTNGISSTTTVNGVGVRAHSGWVSISFPMTAANLSGANPAAVLDSVMELNLVHSNATPLPTHRRDSPDVVATLGIDNISAVVPEPGGAGVMVMALVAAAPRRGRGRRRSSAGRVGVRAGG